MVTIIVVANVAIFFLDAFSFQTGPHTHWLSDAMSVDSDRPWAFWTYLTSGFAHAPINSDETFWHVGGNMILLWFLGRPVEHRIGRFEFLKFYLVAIVLTGVSFTLIRFGTDRIPFAVLGASGGVSAVVGMFVFMYPHEKLFLWGLIPIPAWALGILFVAIDLSRAFGPESLVAWEAHLIGFAFGVAYYKFHWNFSQFSGEKLKRTFKSKPKLRVHNPSGGDEKLKRQADLILQKIQLEGEESLTAKERRVLNKYSNQIRKKRDLD